jgi:1-acyl-sn-glycerol-3-phosphate acyltransferase
MSEPRFPLLPPEIPQYRGLWRRVLGVAGLWSAGWRIDGPYPRLRKFVIVVAPHTSNWDFVYGFLAYLAMRMDASWLAKKEALSGPFGRLGRRFGGIPVDRGRAGHMVETCVAEFQSREGLVLVITPEGTRKKVPAWKRGYHRIAHAAGVPIVPVAIDFSRRAIRFGPPVQPTEDADADERHLQSFFHPGMARHPEQY